jgi:hypothetical protein
VRFHCRPPRDTLQPDHAKQKPFYDHAAKLKSDFPRPGEFLGVAQKKRAGRRRGLTHNGFNPVQVRRHGRRERRPVCRLNVNKRVSRRSVLYSTFQFMLLAEIHGHVRPETRDDEDYLTSSVFGHLRYVQPSIFWEHFLACARGLPIETGEPTLAEAAVGAGCRISCYSQLRIIFWPTHPSLGTPDLLLCFTGPEQRPFVLIIEAKLWANKSGTGDQDQLGRYLDVLGDLGNFTPSLPPDELRNAFSALLYLTPRESISELYETAALRPVGRVASLRLFRAQWQDIIVAASKQIGEGDWIANLVLRDVAAFLRHRGLEYFDGFRRFCVAPPTLLRGSFYQESKGFSGYGRFPIRSLDERTGRYFSHSGLFSGFAHWNDLKSFPIQRGDWV